MCVIHAGLGMAGSGTGKLLEVAGVRMAIGTQGPSALVMSGIDREILSVVVKGRGGPGRLRMAGGTVGGEAGCSMVGICGLVVIIHMAAGAGIRDIGIISVMACFTCNRGMSSLQLVIIIMNGKCGRFPPWRCSVAVGTGIRDIDGNMVWICRLGIGLLMAAETFGRRSAKAIGMTGTAGSRNMRPGQWEFRVIMVKRPGNGAGRVTFIAGDAGIGVSPDPGVLAVHIRLVMRMAVDTNESLITVGSVMTIGAGTPGAGMFSRINRKKLGIVDLETGRFPSGHRSMTVYAACRYIG